MDNAAFDRLVREHGDALSRVTWAYVANSADHDDLMQDVLVALWRALPKFRGDSSERTFVFRIAHNRGCTFAASRREHEALTAESAIVDPRPNPHDEAERSQDRTRLVAAVRALPAAHRQAVLLRLEGFGINEIAALQGTSENNVSVRLSRARDQLRQILGESDR